MATIHEITEDWQTQGLSPTWVKVHNRSLNTTMHRVESVRLNRSVTRWLLMLRGIGGWPDIAEAQASIGGADGQSSLKARHRNLMTAKMILTTPSTQQ